MDCLIPVLNKLQDTFNKIGEKAIDLPQIVVVGSQSSGKSSVLESLVQKDFLPRGSGIVTRRPLVLQLVHVADPKAKEYGVFLHNQTEKFYDFNKIRQEIIDVTNQECGERGVTNSPISLTIFSPTVPDLTLVDLPGLTKVATEGQPETLPSLIRDMVMSFIASDRSIILAVTPANQDIANSDSLLIAREVDPKGQRTIGVLTKIDIMDQGTNCLDVLENKVYPLQLGYIGVINRSQKDINDNKPMDKVIESERKFFVTNSVYSPVADQCGYPYLASTLNHILINHIKKNLPAVHSQINELLRRYNKKLASFGESIGDSVAERQMTIYRIIEDYLKIYTSKIYGYDDLETTGLEGGATIVESLLTDYPEKIKKLNYIQKMDTQTITNIIARNTGYIPSLFFPESSFFVILKDAIEETRLLALEAAEKVAQKIDDIHAKIDLPEMLRFPKVKNAISDQVTTFSKETLERCQEYISTFIDIQKAYFNPSNIEIQKSISLAFTATDIDQRVLLLKNLAYNSYNQIRKEIIDEVPKIIIKMIVKQSVEELRLELFKKLVITPDVTEDSNVAQKRQKCIKLIAALKESLSTINEIRMVHI